MAGDRIPVTGHRFGDGGGRPHHTQLPLLIAGKTTAGIRR
jgi:hypothetical protein